MVLDPLTAFLLDVAQSLNKVLPFSIDKFQQLLIREPVYNVNFAFLPLDFFYDTPNCTADHFRASLSPLYFKNFSCVCWICNSTYYRLNLLPSWISVLVIIYQAC